MHNPLRPLCLYIKLLPDTTPSSCSSSHTVSVFNILFFSICLQTQACIHTPNRYYNGHPLHSLCQQNETATTEFPLSKTGCSILHTGLWHTWMLSRKFGSSWHQSAVASVMRSVKSRRLWSIHKWYNYLILSERSAEAINSQQVTVYPPPVMYSR